MKQGGILSELAAIETVVEICKDKKEKALSISELNLTTPFFTKAQQSAEKLSSFVFENIVSEDVKQKKLAKLICERFNDMFPELVDVRLQGFYCSTDYINNTIINICHHLNNTIKSIDIFKESNLDDNNHAQEGTQNPSKQTDDEKDKIIAELRAEVKRLQDELKERDEKPDDNVAGLKSKIESERNIREDMIKELLSYCFKNEYRNEVKDYLEAIEGRPDTEIGNITKDWSYKLSPKMKVTYMWRILHASKKYESTLQNWSIILNK